MDDDDIWRGEVANELRHIARTLDDVQRQLHDLRCALATEMGGHRDYHARNEHRWGMVRWCERHPFRLAAIVAAVLGLAWAHNDTTVVTAAVRAVLQALGRG